MCFIYTIVQLKCALSISLLCLQCDRMATDCALELKKHNVAFVSLWPGAVRTEHFTSLLQQQRFGTGKDAVSVHSVLLHTGGVGLLCACGVVLCLR